MRILTFLMITFVLAACADADSGSSEKSKTKKENVETKKSEDGKEKSQTKQTAPREDVSPNTDPRYIAETIFNAAYSQDFSKLSGLCHEEIETDGWGRQVCMVAQAREKGRDTFIGMFEQGWVSGEVRVNDGIAQVPVTYGPDGVQEGFLYAIEREGLWYLYGFSVPPVE
jgi:hypothetical protein